MEGHSFDSSIYMAFFRKTVKMSYNEWLNWVSFNEVQSQIKQVRDEQTLKRGMQ